MNGKPTKTGQIIEIVEKHLYKLLKVKTMENIYQKFGKKFNINQAKNMLSMHFRDNTTKNIFI